MRLLIGLALVCTLSSVAMGVAVVQSASGAGATSRAAPSTGEPPFLLVGTGRHISITLRSATSGRTLVDFGSVSGRFTNNGIAADRHSVYLTFIGSGGLEIYRLDAATHRRTFIADGQDPALSPDGRFLAYLAGSPQDNELALHSFVTGQTEFLSLGYLTGSGRFLANGRITWTAGGSRLIVDVPPTPVAVSGQKASARSRQAATPGECGELARESRVCLIIVRVGGGASPSMHAVLSHGTILADANWITVDTAARDAVAVEFFGKPSRVERVVATPGASRSRLILRSFQFLLAVSPDERQALYLVPSTQSIYVATIHDHALVAAHLLISHASLGDVQW